MTLTAPSAPTVSSVKDNYGGETTNPTLPPFSDPNWEDELDDEYGNCPTEPAPAPTPKPQKSYTLTLILAAILVVLANLGILEWKTPGYIGNMLGANKKAIAVPNENKNQESAEEPIKDDSYPFNYEEAYRDLHERVTQLEAQKTANKAELRELNHQMTLLAIVSDENAVIARRLHRNNEFIYINQDWKINRMPSNIKFDERTRTFLQERVR